MHKEYTKLSSVVGPLILVEGISDVSYGEVVDVKLSNGEHRRGQVLEISADKCLIQIFEGTSGINLNGSKVNFTGRSIEISVSI
ncbi:MAG: V-type ATP synthase subunit B, partial [Elusimicrobiota bacterium]|nr:V-type ATP synthase subunit B [Elusimicrobiota bacterium]